MIQGKNIFSQPLDKLKEYSRGEHLKAAKLNETVRAINDMRGMPGMRQKRPAAKGATTTVAGGASPTIGQEFRVLPPAWYDASEKDIIKAVMYWPESQWQAESVSEGIQPWRIQLPWILRRTPFEYIVNQSDAFRGNYYVYDTTSEGNYGRTVKASLDQGADQEIQRIVPIWSSTTTRPEQDVITASKVYVNTGGITRKRTGVQMETNGNLGEYLRTTLIVATGEGDEIPPLMLNAVLSISASDGGPAKEGQIYRWTSTNPLAYVAYDETLAAAAGQTVNVDISWSWRWQMWPDRNWAVRFGS